MILSDKVFLVMIGLTSQPINMRYALMRPTITINNLFSFLHRGFKLLLLLVIIQISSLFQNIPKSVIQYNIFQELVYQQIHSVATFLSSIRQKFRLQGTMV